MNLTQLAILSCTTLGILIAVVFDWKIRKIPNTLTFSLITMGLILNFLNQGFYGLGQSVFGLACGILLLLLPFAMGGVGAGDVKLLGAIGSLFGPEFIFKIFLASAVFGGLFSLIVMVKKGSLRKALQGIKNRIFYVLMTRKIPQEEKWLEPNSKIKIPYAIAIGSGTLFILLMAKGG
ncbi:MAG: prepilin peptidase [Candidatus Omnitrophica bacterium]|nr:prepilin peptidase [Candidatus Omnitrophota bacterium]